MEFFGLTDADYADENIAWVWPCNVPVVNLFVALGTQWLVGPCGPYGLNYAVMYQKLDRMRVSHEVAEQMEEDIRILEDAALEQMRKDQE
jgi:hypothetical protein